MKSRTSLTLAAFSLIVGSMSTAQAAVICGETVDTSQIEVKDNYLGGVDCPNKAFLDAEILEGRDLRVTICDLASNRYLIVKKAGQPASSEAGALVFAYPIEMPSDIRAYRCN